MALWKPKGQSNRENKRYLNEVTILRLLDKIGVRRQEKSSVGNKNYPPYRLRPWQVFARLTLELGRTLWLRKQASNKPERRGGGMAIG